MPFSHHSHSGQFCPHATDTLEEMVQSAISRSMQTFALTEHMPRHDQDLYPEEVAIGWNHEEMERNHQAFVSEAIRLRAKYQGKIQLLIGFESEWIRPGSLDLISHCLRCHSWDLFVGSVHHVHCKPIDYDQADFDAARQLAGGSEEQLFIDYFDAQYAMLQATLPPIIGHFDLIRLKSKDPDRDLREWKSVWERIRRNLEFIADYGGLLEINFASLRKGLQDPYPRGEIAQSFVQIGGRFCISDDSHGVKQVALNYSHCIPYLERHHIDRIFYLDEMSRTSDTTFDSRFPSICLQSLSLEGLKASSFWTVTAAEATAKN